MSTVEALILIVAAAVVLVVLAAAVDRRRARRVREDLDCGEWLEWFEEVRRG